MRMTVQTDLAAFSRGLEAEAKRLQTAARFSANELAWLGVEAIRDQMRRVFFLPRPYLQNGLTVDFARDRDFATVRWLEPRNARGGPGAGRVLRAQIEGGRRRDKRLERALSFLGLPDGLIAVPGPAAKLDAGGDMSGAQLRNILRELKSQGPALRRRYFVIMNRGGKIKIPRGIYAKKRSGPPELVVAFVREGDYNPRFSPVDIVRDVVRRERLRVWQLALERRLPLRTSRGAVRA